jgi:hypothetical protein
MSDRKWIIGGLLVFLGLVTLPAWYNRQAAKSASGPDLQLPAGEKECVAPVAEMNTLHRKLLNEWRDLAVRRDVRTFTAYNGISYPISLTGTCLQRCHKNKAQFCDRCHAYHGLREPNCWDCHVDPQRIPPAVPRASSPRAGEPHDPR